MSTANESGLPEEPAEDTQPADGDLPEAAEPALEAAPTAAASSASAQAGEPGEATESGAETVLDAAAEAEAQAARERAAFDELVASFHSETAPDPVPRRIIRHTVLNTPPEWIEPIIEPSDETTVDKYFPSEHYEPPEPPPLPEASGATKASWTMLVGGVLFLLLRTLLGWETEPWMFYLALASILGGIISLFARMRPERDEYDDPDNGAVV